MSLSDQFIFGARTIHYNEVGGKSYTLTHEAISGLLMPPIYGRSNHLLPRGLKGIICDKNYSAFTAVAQISPRIHQVRWPQHPEGRRVKRPRSRQVEIACPYVIFLLPFRYDLRNRSYHIKFIDGAECFFSLKPISGITDYLFFPSLPNVYTFKLSDRPSAHPLARISTKGKRFSAIKDYIIAISDAMEKVYESVFDAKYLLSDHQDATDLYYETFRIDHRLHPVENWEQNSKTNPIFVLDVPWVPTGLTLRSACARIIKLQRKNLTKRMNLDNIQDLANFLVAHGEQINVG